MSDIVLLITGVLSTGQLPPPTLPNQPVIQLENSVKRSSKNEQNQLIATAKIAPPEFIQSNIDVQPSFSTIKPEYQDILSRGRKKILSKFESSQDAGTHREILLAKEAKPSQLTRQPLPNLYFGTSGVSVKVLQRLLLFNGYNVRVDGTFGALTESAVKAFQFHRNMTADGFVGQRTWRELAR
jgi:peptidoglycan hydrolase-like protein with peptidoglycan-binding domain